MQAPLQFVQNLVHVLSPLAGLCSIFTPTLPLQHERAKGDREESLAKNLAVSLDLSDTRTDSPAPFPSREGSIESVPDIFRLLRSRSRHGTRKLAARRRARDARCSS